LFELWCKLVISFSAPDEAVIVVLHTDTRSVIKLLINDPVWHIASHDLARWGLSREASIHAAFQDCVFPSVAIPAKGGTIVPSVQATAIVKGDAYHGVRQRRFITRLLFT
jgi:hypothetical protein